MNRRHFLHTTLAASAASCLRADDVPPVKKLLGFAWHAPSVAVLAGGMEALAEKTPWLDGVTFSLREKKPHQWAHLDAFSSEPWTEETLSFSTLKTLRWRDPFRHNFVWMAAGPNYDTSATHWFDDEAWRTVVKNARLLSRAVAESGARGIFLDTENYSGLWHYWNHHGLVAKEPKRICHYPGLTFAKVEDKVRQRAAEWMDALQSTKPDIVVFASTLLSFGANLDSVETAYFPLLRAFTHGLIAAAAPGVVLVDGLENTYWTNDSTGFDWWRKRMRDSAAMLPAELRERWQRQSRTGMAVFFDGIIDSLHAAQLTADAAYRLRWLEHNIHHALTTNDEWTWLYMERRDPWQLGGGKAIAAEESAAIAKARTTAATGKPAWHMKARTLDLSQPSDITPL